MNTHTIIIKCRGNEIPDLARLHESMDSFLNNPQMEYFGRNGNLLYSNPKGLMKSLKGRFFIRFSFRHLLQLDSSHAMAVIRAALKMNMVKFIRRAGDGIEVVLP